MFPSFELTNIAMVYVLGATIAGLRFGRVPAVMSAVANVAAFDFFFVPPRYTFAVSDVQYVVTFAVMLLVTLVIANLMANVRQQTRVAGARERRTALLYAMSRELAATRGIANMAEVAARHVAEVFDCEAVLLLPDDEGRLQEPRHAPGASYSPELADLSIAQWVADHGRRAGLGSDTLPSAPALYVPLGEASQRLGVLAVLPRNRRRVLLPEQLHLLETFASQIGLALERAQLTESAEEARVSAESERLRNTMLASISHDLRTPLAVMGAAASTLARREPALPESTRIALAASIEDKAHEMTDLISNVLDLTRLESGQVALRRDWETLDDLAASALRRVEGRARTHQFVIDLAPDLPAVHVDAALVVQVFANLFDNVAEVHAGRHAHPRVRGCRRAVRARDGGRRRPGLPAGRPGAAVRQVPARRGRAGDGRRRPRPRDLPRDRRGARRRDPRPAPARPRRALRVHAAGDGARRLTEAMHQVLVVEDEPGIRRVLRVLLEAEGYRVVEAETAARAEIEARTHKPDLLIVDLGLPDGTGST